MYKDEKQITLTRYRDLLHYNCEHFYSIAEKEEYHIIGKDTTHLYLRKGIETSCADLDSPILMEILVDTDNAILQSANTIPTRDQVTISMMQELLRAALCDLQISPSCVTCARTTSGRCKEIHDGGCPEYRWRYKDEVMALLQNESDSICTSCSYYKDGQCDGDTTTKLCSTN